MRGRDDDDGQNDGDEPPSRFISPGQPGSPFAASFGVQPWLRNALPPWHMWGNFAPLRVDSQGLDPDHGAQNLQQLVRIKYKRPTTWSFFFAARLTSAEPIQSATVEVDVAFQLATGIGRSNFSTNQGIAVNPFNTPAFCKFKFILHAGDIPANVPAKYAQRVPALPMNDNDPTNVQQIDWIPAQDIQISAQLIVLPVLVPAVIVYEAEAHAYFAPRTHVRPDWYMPGPPEQAFLGDEVGGS